jgi:hypothetical protein
VAASVEGAARQFADLAKNLREIGEEGLRRELFQAIDEAAQPVADEIGNVTHLRDFMPNRYADVLARDLKVSTHKTTGGADPGVTLLVRAPTVGRGGRKVAQRNAGVITHPVFAQAGTPRRSWRWRTQTAGMRPGFADDPVERAAPHVRDKIQQAVHRITGRALGR